MTPQVRLELAKDASAIRAVHIAAFPASAEADLVDALRDAGAAQVSLVAVVEDNVVGHILFSLVRIELDGDQLASVFAAGLAPVAVLPEFQNQGIGAALINAGLTQCKEIGIQAVVLLGHPDYYPRFGFKPAGPTWSLRCQWECPPEAFMALELVDGALDGVRGGMVQYHEAFEGLG